MTLFSRNAVAAEGINDKGQIVGYYVERQDKFSPKLFYGFLDRHGHYTRLNDPQGKGRTHPYDINDAGQVVGYYLTKQGRTHGFLYSEGEYTPFIDPHGRGKLNTEAVFISNNGKITGEFYPHDSASTLGFLYSNGHYIKVDDPLAVVGTDAEGVNNKGQVVGQYYDNQEHANGFLYSHGQYTTLDDPDDANGFYGGTNLDAINNKGVIVGFYSNSTGLHGLIDRDGNFRTLNDPHGTDGTLAYGINQRDQIVGVYLNSRDRAHAFLYSHGHYTNVANISLLAQQMASFTTAADGHDSTPVNTTEHTANQHAFLATPHTG
jgi:probable HAF family extracellular repeat protein